MTRDEIALKLFLWRTKDVMLPADKFGKPSKESARDLVKKVWPACEVLAQALLEEGHLAAASGSEHDF